MLSPFESKKEGTGAEMNSTLTKVRIFEKFKFENKSTVISLRSYGVQRQEIFNKITLKVN